MEDQSEFTDMKGLAEPARRALAGAGFTKLFELQAITEQDLSKLHGMGPKALRVIGEYLTARGMSFKSAGD